MKKAKLSARETVMLVLLVVLLIGVVYYMAFLTPLQAEIAGIQTEVEELDLQIQSYQDQLLGMNAMKTELEKLDKQTEVAPYDNLVEVLVALDQYLYDNSVSYTLTFLEPEITEEGTVRRIVEMEFECLDYDAARAMVDDLTGNKWRCLVGDTLITTVNENTNLRNGLVKVQLNVTFFELSGTSAT